MPFKPPPNFEVPSGKAFRTHVFHVLPTGRLVPGLLMIGPNSLLFMPFPSRTAAYAAKFCGKAGNNLAISYVTVENIMTCVTLESPLFSYTKTHVIRALSCLDSADNKRVASQIQLIKSVGQEASGEIIHILPAIVPPRMKREKYRTLNLEFLRKILSFKTKYHLHGVSTISNNNVSSAILALRLDQLVGQNAGEPPLNHRFLRLKTYDGRLFTFFGLPRKIVSTLAELTGYLLGHHAGTRDAAAAPPGSPGDLLPGDSATLSCADASEHRESSSDAPTKARRRLKVRTNAPAQAISLRPGDESSCSDVLSELSFLSNESDVAAAAADGDAADGLDGPRAPGAPAASGPTESASTQSIARHDAPRRLAVGYMKLLRDHLHKDLIESTSGTENFSYYGFEPPLIPALRGPATYSRYARRARHYHSKASSNALKNEQSTRIVQDAGVVDSANLLLYLTVKTDAKTITKEQARRKFDKLFMTCAYYRWAASTAYGSHVDEFAPYDKLTKYAATESALNDSGQLQRYWDMMAADVGVAMQKLKARLQCACFDVVLPSDARFHREVRQLRLRTDDLSDSDLLIDIPIVKEPFKNRSKARQIIRASKEVLRKSLEINDINVSESETDVSGCLATRSGSYSDDPAHGSGRGPGRKAGGRGGPGGAPGSAGKGNRNDEAPGAADDGPASRDSNGLAAHLGRPSKVLRRESLEVRLEDCFDHATLFGKSLAAESRLVAVTRAMLQKADQEGPASLTAELVDQRINIMILECLDVIANSNVIKEIARNIEYYTLVMPVRDGEILNLFKDYASKPTLDEKVPLNAADQMFSYKNLYLNYVPSATLVRLIKEEQAKHEEELRNKIIQAGGRVDADAPLTANYSLGNKFVNHTASSILNIEEVKFLIHNFHRFHELGTPISNYKLCLTYSVKRDGSHISNIFRATSAAFQGFAAKHYLLETEHDKKERIENAGKIHSLTQARSRTGMEGTSLLVLQLQNGWRCGAYVTEPLTTDSKPHGTQDNFVFSIYPPGGAGGVGSVGGADSAGNASSMGGATAPGAPDASAASAAAAAGAGSSTGSAPGSMLIVSQDGLPVNSEYTNEKVFSPLKLEEDIARRFSVFPGTTANKVYQVGTATNITIGAGGSSALSINDTLKFVTTGKSETYANNYLFEGEVFPKFMRGRIVNLEVLSVVVVDRFKR